MPKSLTPSPDRPGTPMETGARISAVALIGATLLALADLLSQWHVFALGAIALIILHVAARWRRVRINARTMLVAAGVAAAVMLFLGGGAEELGLAASRALYLPALLAVMTLLRVAAQRSRPVQVAAHFVVDQPPSRRFLFLAAGGHVFGMLLNIGGLQLLLGIALAERDRTSATPAVKEVQGRRITNAILRGFGATLLWSPLGVAINLLLPIMPSLEWIGYLPYGLALVMTFLLLGWIFDRLEPRPKRAFVPQAHDGAGRALLALGGLLLSITGLAALSETLLGVPLRAAILVIIPLMAVVWALATATGRPGPALATLGRDGFRALPGSVSEICLIGSTGFLGLVIAGLIPAEAVRSLVDVLALGPGALGCTMILLMTVASLAGISPMITGTALAGAILSAGVGMPEPMIMVAALCGWAGTMMLSPVTATVAIASGALNRPASEVGLRWNGPFALSFLVVTMAGMLIWGALL